MADVILGPAGAFVLVDLGICAKTGEVTNERAVLGGRTRPAWVTVLLVFSVIGFLFADAVTSRRYRVDLPFSHAAHGRWRDRRRLAWAVGLVGAGSLVLAASGTAGGGVPAVAGAAAIAGALVLGVVNAVRNSMGVRLTRGDQLLLTRAHPAFARAAEVALIEPLDR
jgi:hypothetical protein